MKLTQRSVEGTILNRTLNLVLPVLLFMLISAVFAPVYADSFTYSYVGHTFNMSGGPISCPPDCRITGSFTVSSPLLSDASYFFTPQSFSFTDGNYSFNPTDVTSSAFGVVTNSLGQIIEWNMNWFIGSVAMFSNTGVTTVCTDTVNCRVVDGIFTPTAFSEVDNNSGVWTGQVPEPSSLSLLCIGALGLLGFFFKKAIA